MAELGRIVVVTGREEISTPVRRLGALVGAATDVVATSAAVRSGWRSARMIVIGADLVGAVAAAGLPRRDAVVVVGDADPDPGLWRAAVELGALRVLELPANERELAELMSAAIDVARSAGSTIAVIGGCGGAGASTVAAALAVTGVRSGPTVLIDADRLGGGLDILLGAEQAPGARWSDLAATRGRLDAATFAAALVQLDGIALLSYDRAGRAGRAGLAGRAGGLEPAESGSDDVASDAATAVIDAANRAFRWVVVDLPRRLDPAAMVLAVSADVVLVVVPASVRATTAAAAVANQLRGSCRQLQLIVRDPGSGRLAATEVGDALGLPVAATFASEAAVATAADRGEPPLRRARGSLHEACTGLLVGSTTVTGQVAA